LSRIFELKYKEIIPASFAIFTDIFPIFISDVFETIVECTALVPFELDWGIDSKGLLIFGGFEQKRRVPIGITFKKKLKIEF
jgi:hypothetical protein